MELGRVSVAVPILLCLLIAGCSWMPFVGERKPTRRGPPVMAHVIADLPELELPTALSAKPTREEVLEAYQRVYGLVPDATENQAVGRRLADLRMGVGEELDVAGADNPYEAAVALYETLLANADAQNKDQILYQLARAHDVVGETDQSVKYLNILIGDYPDSQYVVEARFRRAEIEFTRHSFGDAARDYGVVAALGDATPYRQNATYMLGWSLFKKGDLDDALTSFFVVIDDLLTGEAGARNVASTDKDLLEDTFRVVVLALGYLDGPQTLAARMDQLERPHWQYQAYRQLADHYLEDQRYLDNVATWQIFIEHNGLDARAPAAHVGMIETLVRAGFPSEIRTKKTQFVKRYGVHSEFWSVHDEATRASYLATLETYLQELASIAHSQALKSGKRRDFLSAAAWYEQIVATLQDDPGVAEYHFLLGEVYTEASDHGKAVQSFQTVVHEFPQFTKAPEAGYAAILGFEELVAAAPRRDLEALQRFKIDAQIEFALLFANDPRAPAVQAAAADSLFALGDFAEAVDLADNLLNSWSGLSPELSKTALLILGHGRFEMEDFVGAEIAYQQLLVVDLTAAERSRAEERLLAAVYKQGEASEAVGDMDATVAHFLRLRDLSPDSELAAQGQFDAVAVIEASGRIAEAAQLLADFRWRHPNHELNQGLDQRLADMYERTENWPRAAGEYLTLAANAEDSEVRRQSLYRAAELYLQLDDVERAITHFRDYANTYKKPLDLRMEAADHLDQLYQRTKQDYKRRFWLKKKIVVQREMGSAATARATFLAAQAQNVLATDERALFDAARLTHPLPKSLKAKQKALQNTLKAFEKVAAYQVAEFSTGATYQIADLYAALSTALMGSDRPGDLSELELEQYEILLEEQAFPFEEQAISLHEINMRRSWDGVYDDWVKLSFTELGRLMPARFDKQELEVAYVEIIH